MSLVECPYNPEHKMPLDSLLKHFSKCKSMKKLQRHFKVCPFNPLHHIPTADYDAHIEGCKDKNPLLLPALQQLTVVLDPSSDVGLIPPPPGFEPAASPTEVKEAVSPAAPPVQDAAWSEVKAKKPKKKADNEGELQSDLSLAELQLRQSVDQKKRKQEIKKKLKDIDNLQGKQGRGEVLDVQQLEKVRKRKALEDELNSLS